MRNFLVFLAFAVAANAHFLTMIPTTDNVKSKSEANIK